MAAHQAVGFRGPERARARAGPGAGQPDATPAAAGARRAVLDPRLHADRHQRGFPARPVQPQRGLRHAALRSQHHAGGTRAPGGPGARALRRGATPHRGCRRRPAVGRRSADQGAVGRRGHTGAPALGDRGHPLPAGPGGPFPRRADPLRRLGDAHRRDAGEPGAAGGAGGSAARGVVVQPGRLLEGRRRRPVAVHALDGTALHAHRQRGG